MYVKCAPRILRADMGTENNSISFLQPLFRYNSTDSMAGIKEKARQIRESGMVGETS